jgi:DNA polymerase III subunit beta
MKIRIPVPELARSLSMMQGIVQRKNTMPILSNVLLEATNDGDGKGKLILSATDLDVGMRTIQVCEVMEEGRVTVPARALSDIVRVLPGPDVSFHKLQNNHIEVKSGRTKARLLGLSADEYPALPSYEDVTFSSFDAKLFVDMVEKTSYAASTDETRYNLNGVLVESAPAGAEDPNLFVMVATDGHRLVHIERSFDGISESGWGKEHQSVILPRKGLAELKRLIDGEGKTEKSDTPLQVGFHENHAVVQCGGTVLGMRLIDGAFPDYRQVIPKLADKLVRISRSDLSASLRRVSVLTSDKSQPVKLTLTKDQLLVSCANADTGEISDDVPVEYNGEDIEVAFNARYLADALNSMDDTNVLLKLTDGLSPGLLVGVDETHHLCVVMPMRW